MVHETDDDEGLMESVHLLKSRANAARLLRSINDAEHGKLVEHELVERRHQLSRLRRSFARRTKI
jgi:hypothetical protein